MSDALVLGLIASSGLVVGAVLGALWTVPRKLTGILLAFASGALIAAVALELVPVAVRDAGPWTAGIGLLVGAAVFVGLNAWVDRSAAPVAAARDEGEHVEVIREGSSGLGILLLASVTLDGLPENLALGVASQEGARVGLLVAIAASNLPEALVGGMAMRKAGRSRRFVMLLWTVTAGLLVAAVVGGRALGVASESAAWLGALMALAGGALLASLADTLMPEAFTRGQPVNAFATVAGFFLSFMLA